METKNKKLKLISTLLIISIVLPAVLFFIPQKASAFWGFGDATIDSGSNIVNGIAQTGSGATGAGAGVGNAATNASSLALKVKDVALKVLEEALKAVAKRLLAEVTKSTINWINSGFHGSPLFLENPGSFFADVTKSEIKNIVNTYGYDLNKFPFGKDFALGVISSYKRTLESNSAYTLNNVMSSAQLVGYRSNFNVGGWNGFLVNTQYPQNNYLGFQMIATEELARRVAGTAQSAAQQVRTTLSQGNGFLSPKNCPSNPAYNNGVNEFQKPAYDASAYINAHKIPACKPQYDANGDVDGNLPCLNESEIIAAEGDFQLGLEADKQKFTEKNTCPGGLKATTPGSVVGNQIMNALGSGQKQSELATALGGSLSAILDALINKFIGDGLTSLASKINPPPPDDTWSYEGQKLGGSGDGSDPFSYPDEIVVLKDFKELLSGYYIGTCTDIKEINSSDNITDSPDQNDIKESQCLSLVLKPTWIKNADDTSTTPLGTCSNIVGRAEETDVTEKACSLQIYTPTWTQNDPGKDYVQGDIARTEQEIRIIDNPICDPIDTVSCPPSNPANKTGPNYKYYIPGITQLIKLVPEMAHTLDMCIPGPDKGWEGRLEQERSFAARPIENESTQQDDLKVRGARSILADLKFAVASYQDWVNTKMLTALPGSVLYLDAIKDIDSLTQQSSELVTAKQTKTQTLARMKVLETTLNNMETQLKALNLTQPEVGSVEEKQLVGLKKQYNAIRSSISSVNSIEDKLSELNILIGKLDNLSKLNTQCNKERIAKGWSAVDTTGRGLSVLSSAAGKNINRGTAETVYDSSGAYSEPVNSNYTTTGTEIEQFCDLPISRGYSHGEIIRADSSNRSARESTSNQYTFRNERSPKGDSGYQDLPMVNGQWVWGDVVCTGLCSWPEGVSRLISGGWSDLFGGDAPEDQRTSINMKCDAMFKSRNTDYSRAGDISFTTGN